MIFSSISVVSIGGLIQTTKFLIIPKSSWIYRISYTYSGRPIALSLVKLQWEVRLLQEIVLEQLDKKFNKPTYKDLVEITGIEQTRLFRIRNGSLMRVDELETILTAIGDHGLGLSLFFECHKYLDVEAVNEIERKIRRKINIEKLKRSEL